jgi:hypothetical protein
MRGRRGWWPWVTAGAGLAALVLVLVVTVVPLRAENGLTTSADIAQLTALLVAAGTAAVVIVRWAWRTDRSARAAPTAEALARAKDALADAVAEQWQLEAALRSLGDPAPIPVRWRPPTGGLMDHAVNIEPAGAPARGGLWWTASSADIAPLVVRFRRTRRRRLVILGGPGTGKTTLAMQLLLQLLATRAEHPDEPVPVMLPVAGWDTERFPRLHEWLADQLPRDYPVLRSPGLGREITRALTARGHILAVLDGLDELPPRAQAKLISALNRSLTDHQFILTSRTTEFSAAVTAAGRVVTSAAVLEPRPVDPPAAADYLARCLPPVPGPDWDDILTDLRRAPPADASAAIGSGAGPMAALAGVVATPLGLWLLRSAYLAPSADPAALARFPAPAALRTHLFEGIIEALIDARPASKDSADPLRPRRHHDPARVRRRLGYLAHHLGRQPATAGGDTASGTRDFAWWRLAATTNAITYPTRAALALVTMIMASFVIGFPYGPGFRPEDWFPYMFTGGLVMGLSARSWAKDSPGYADLRIRDRGGEFVRKLMTGLATGFAILLVALLPGGLAAGFQVLLLIALMGGFTFGLVSWAETPARIHHAITPMSSWRADRTLNLLRMGTAVVAVGLAGAFAGGLAVGLAAAVALGPPLGFLLGRHRAWPAYLIATSRLARAGLLPRRLMPFLDDCHRLGLLRAVGPIYQFRHADLQDHLAATYDRATRSRLRLDQVAVPASAGRRGAARRSAR